MDFGIDEMQKMQIKLQKQIFSLGEINMSNKKTTLNCNSDKKP